MKAFILIGIPGAGKSTWAKNNRAQHDRIFSADDHRMVDGVYTFKAQDSAWAHGECLKGYVDWLHEDMHYFNCFVDNTNCTIAEVAPYIALGLAYDVDVRPIHLPCNTLNGVERNVHGVPLHAVSQLQQNMLQMFRDWPSYWPRVEQVAAIP